jgi:hypothetical protein
MMQEESGETSNRPALQSANPVTRCRRRRHRRRRRRHLSRKIHQLILRFSMAQPATAQRARPNIVIAMPQARRAEAAAAAIRVRIHPRFRFEASYRLLAEVHRAEIESSNLQGRAQLLPRWRLTLDKL